MDVIVVGAGIIGLSTAWTLQRRGASVTVVDPAPGTGATHAAAGMLAPAAEVVWGQSPLYPLMRAAADLYPEFAADLTAASGLDLGHSDAETLVCAADRADLTALRELVTAQSGAGFDVALLPGSRARDLEPALSPGVCGAVRIPGDHSIDPRRVVTALRRVLGTHPIAASARGLRLTGDRVTGVELDDGRTLFAERVVIAAGADCRTIEGVPSLPLREVFGEVIRLRAPEQLAPLLTRTIRGLVLGRPVYVVPRPDGELVLGATSREDGRPGMSAGGIHQLLRDAERLVPGILDCEITDITTRARPGSPDDLPIIGSVGKGCIVSTGYFRHGILLAPLGARLTADLVLGESSDWAPPGTLESVSPRRFAQARPRPSALHSASSPALAPAVVTSAPSPSRSENPTGSQP